MCEREIAAVGVHWPRRSRQRRKRRAHGPASGRCGETATGPGLVPSVAGPLVLGLSSEKTGSSDFPRRCSRNLEIRNEGNL